MRRTRVRHRAALALVVGVTLGIVVALSGRPSTGPIRPAGEHRYVVRPGDTLWSIAGRYQGSGDRRPLVDAIQRANRIDPGALVPGEALLVPVPT